jgi:hypothetical protein
MIHFEGSLTMGDIIGNLYGRHGQVATVALGFLFTLCVVSAQVMALAYVYEFPTRFQESLDHWSGRAHCHYLRFYRRDESGHDYRYPSICGVGSL